MKHSSIKSSVNTNFVDQLDTKGQPALLTIKTARCGPQWKQCIIMVQISECIIVYLRVVATITAPSLLMHLQSKFHSHS